MPDPWTFLGWLLTGSLGLLVAVLCCFVFYFALRALARQVLSVAEWLPKHLRTRNIPPQAGQTWCNHKSIRMLRVTLVKDGRVCITSGNTGWSDSGKEWRRRVRRQRLCLVAGPNSPREAARG